MKPSPASPPPHADEHPELSAANARSGLVLFALYSAFYVTFVVLSAFSPDTMAMRTPLGPNLAILYGFGLIGGAFLLALVYMLLCSRNYDRHSNGNGQQGSKS